MIHIMYIKFQLSDYGFYKQVQMTVYIQLIQNQLLCNLISYYDCAPDRNFSSTRQVKAWEALYIAWLVLSKNDLVFMIIWCCREERFWSGAESAPAAEASGRCYRPGSPGIRELSSDQHQC